LTIKETLDIGAKRLKNVAKRPLFEAEILLSNVLEVNRVYLHLYFDQELEKSIFDNFFEDIDKRANYYPIEYITKKVSFYSEEFFIEEGVLIPRPETEILIDKVLENVDKEKEYKVAEIGIGSGVISIILASYLKKSQFIATDISKKAIEVAKKNIKKFALEKRIEVRICSYLDCVDEKIDIIVSNPPYISLDFKLDKNVLYEPKEALFGGRKGDEVLKKIIDLAIKKDVKLLVCEMGYDQRDNIKKYCETKGLKPEFYKDLAGLDRGFVLKVGS